MPQNRSRVVILSYAFFSTNLGEGGGDLEAPFVKDRLLAGCNVVSFFFFSSALFLFTNDFAAINAKGDFFRRKLLL